MVNFFVAFIQALRYCRGCLNDDSPISARPCSSQSEQPAQMAAPILYLNLAPELHFLITEFLPLHSVVASTLTCKQLLNIHGSHKWDLLSQDPDARSKFFLLLEKDLPGYYLRYSTDRFMKKRFLGSDPRNYVQEPLQQYPGEFTYNVLATRFNYTLSWSHLILALKCEQYGDKYGLTIESFRHRATSTLRSDTVSGPLYHVGISVKPRIIANHLLLKCTYRICRTKQQQYMGLSVNELKCLPLDLCRHMSAQYRLSPWFDNSLASKFRARNCRYRTKSYSEDSTSDTDADINAAFPPRDNDVSTTFEGSCSFCMTDWLPILAVRSL